MGHCAGSRAEHERIVTLWNWFGSGTNTQHFNYTTGLVIPPNSTIFVEALNTPGQACVQLQKAI
jgi:hypothetical protein